MRMVYDRTVDALAIELVEDGRSARMVELAPGTRVDLDAAGRLLTVEVLNASGLYPRDALEVLGTAEVWLGLAAAAKESGLERDTLRVLIHAGRLNGRKAGRDWQVTRAALANYLESRKPAGRPAKRKKARRAPRVALR